MNMHVMSALNQNQALMRRARFLNLSFGVAIDEECYLVVTRPGDVSVTPVSSIDQELPFTIQASRQAWDEFASASPRPGFQDVIAMAESGNGQIVGKNLLPFFGNLLFVKGVVSALFRGNASW